jgi:hypothetical protein
MNRQERRAHEASWRKAYRNRTLKEASPGADEGYMMIDNAGIPADIKADVARTASSIEFHGLSEGGDCWLRAAIGYKTLTNLGWSPRVELGGVLFRVGPDPRRDVVAFCGRGNYGYAVEGGMLGHVWLRLDEDLIDFSCKDWPRLYKPDDELGPVQWQVQPPSVIWADRDLFSDWQREGTPDLGKVWFCPWRGPPPALFSDFDRFLAPAETFGDIIASNIARLCLAERVSDYRKDPAGYSARWHHRMRERPATAGAW